MEEKIELRWWKVVVAAAELVSKAFPLPESWSDESKVKPWLEGLNEPSAKLIVALATSAEGRRVLSEFPREFASQAKPTFSAAVAKGDPVQIDWSTLIDWTAAALIAILPQYAAVIKLVAEILKQLLASLPKEA